MRTMRFLSLYLLSMRERRGLSVNFSPAVTLLRGPNGHGKSAIAKSLYDTFGAVPHKVDRSWRSANVASLVHFSVDEIPYSILKSGDRYSVFNDAKRKLIDTAAVGSELAPFLADLLDFQLIMADRDKRSVTPPPAYIFAPFYVDQDHGWTKPWESFTRMYLPDSKRVLSNYHTGLRPNAYYVALARRDHQRIRLAELQEERNTLRRALDEVRGLVEDVALNYDVQDFSSETEMLVLRSSELNHQQAAYRERLLALSEERALWQDQQSIIRAAFNDMRSTVSLASDQPEEVECPTCGQHYDNSLASRFGLVSQFDDLFEAYQEGDQATRNIDEKLVLARRQLATIEAKVGEIDRILDATRGETTLGLVISVQGRNETASLLRRKIEILDAQIGEALQALKDAEAVLKRSIDPERTKEITRYFDWRRQQYAENLDVRLQAGSQDITSPHLARGSEGPRGLITYYYTVLQTARRFGSSAFCPIVIDAPNQQGQDAKHLPEILRFLVDERPDDSQLIVATEELFGIDSDEATVIDVGIGDNQVLDDSKFESVALEMRPYFGHLI